jgi:hypothetical protein
MTAQLPTRVDLSAYRGDTWSQTFRFKHDTTPVDLTGATVAAWAQPLYTGAVVFLTVTIRDPIAGEVQIALGPDGLPAGSYTYDVQVTIATVVTTWVRGTLTVTADITPPALVAR